MNLNEIKTIGIAGAGVMGSSFAQIFAKYEYQVAIYDVADEILEKSRKLIELNQQTLVEQGELTQGQSDAIKNRMQFGCDMKVMADADFIMEAIVEKMDIKQALTRLSQRDNELVRLIFNAGLSYTEVSEVLDIPVGTVKSRMSAIKTKLRASLGGEGII